MTHTSVVTYRHTKLIPALFVLGLLATIGLFNYLLFHNLVELFSVIVAGSIFIISWNTRRIVSNGYLLYMGIAALYVGGFDLLHALSYQGMGVFPGAGNNFPTQLWIAARYMQALSFLVAPVFLTRRLRQTIVFSIYGIFSGLILLSIVTWKIFPACYIDGLGLTSFKKDSEYIIIGILGAAVLFLFFRREKFDRDVLQLLTFSVGASMLSEAAFTTYVGVYDFASLLGHILKAIAFYTLYQAIIVTGLVRPYHLLFRDLKSNENALRELTDELDSRVKARTRELIDANEELQNYHTQLEGLVEQRTQDLIFEIEERKRAEASVNAYAARLEEKNRELEDFAFIVSHDLQEPLRKIQTFGKRILDKYSPALDEEGVDFLNRIISSAARLRSMIDCLLDYSRISTRGQPFTRVDLASLASETLADLEVSIEASHARVFLDTLPSIEADPVQIRQLFQNLISNAIKFRKASIEPIIRISGKNIAMTDGERVEIQIEDNGIGFDVAHVDQIFQPFHRLHGRREYEGYGIGLAICQKIVERHHGQITAQSKPGEGSRFIITLPVTQGDDR